MVSFMSRIRATSDCSIRRRPFPRNAPIGLPAHSILSSRPATTSPAAVEIEAHVIRAVARRAGFPPEAAGHFTSGGSEANYTALICALTRANPEFATKGARAFEGAPVFYVSRESHLAWIKIAHQAGIGRSAVRLVATDGFGRMDQNALRDAIIGDRLGGCVPIMIAATAGTTNAGMIDPLWACAELARIAGSGITSTRPGAARSSRPIGCGMFSAGSSAPIPSRSTRTSGLRRRWAAGCSSPGTRRYCRPRSRFRPALCPPTFRVLTLM